MPKQVAFRCPDALVDRIDAFAKKVMEEMPGLRFSRAAAIKVLLERALDESERQGSQERTS